MVQSLVSRTTWLLGIWTALCFTIWKDKYLPTFRRNVFRLRVMLSRNAMLGFDCRTLKINVMLSTETSVIIYQAVRHIVCSNTTVKTSNPSLLFVYICQNRTAVRPNLVSRYSPAWRCGVLHLLLNSGHILHLVSSGQCFCCIQIVFNAAYFTAAISLFQFQLQLSLSIPALTQYLHSQVV